MFKLYDLKLRTGKLTRLLVVQYYKEWWVGPLNKVTGSYRNLSWAMNS